ncbi:MAG: 30S ribosomal protein S6 [Thermodesulfovibrio sp. RBG_19FT_COMBO_42_12]|nr:MAG: 30S ribosomal protein S6 [Thermodesulfovibrio sp. RBG_19FT_COMBO_42_12]
MNVYENIVILNSALSDEEAETAITKIKELIAGQGGEVLKVNIWGRKKLAYEIKKQKKGLYVLLIYKTPPASIKKIEEFYKVFDAVLKYVIIKLSAKQIHDLEKLEAASEPAEQKSEV